MEDDYNSPTKRWWEPWIKIRLRQDNEENAVVSRDTEEVVGLGDQWDIGYAEERENIGWCPSFQTTTLGRVDSPV